MTISFSPGVKKSLIAAATTAMIGATTMVVQAPAAGAIEVANLQVNKGKGVGAWAQDELRMYSDRAAVFEQIRQLRREAWDDPRIKVEGKTIPQRARDFGFTTKDAYVNGFAWDGSLEHEVVQRAAEASLRGGHDRPDGSSPFSVPKDGMVYVVGEQLASTPLLKAVEAFAGEKADLINNTGRETGHYVGMIDPMRKYYAFAGFGDQSAAFFVGKERYKATNDPRVPEGEVLVTLTIKDADARKATWQGHNTIAKDQYAVWAPVVQFSRAKVGLVGKFTSDNTNVARLLNDEIGQWAGVAPGTAGYRFQSVRTDGGTPMTMRSTVTVTARTTPTAKPTPTVTPTRPTVKPTIKPIPTTQKPPIPITEDPTPTDPTPTDPGTTGSSLGIGEIIGIVVGIIAAVAPVIAAIMGKIKF